MFSPETLASFRAMPDERVATHPFLDFFEQRIPALSELVGAGGESRCSAQLQHGLMHCDFFLDNILVHEAEPGGANSNACTLSALIDWEDAAAGPLLHDLGIGILGCCYDAEERLSAERVSAMLTAYNQIRPLKRVERQSLRQSVLGAALAVGFFRWRQFNVRHPEIVEVGIHLIGCVVLDTSTQAGKHRNIIIVRLVCTDYEYLLMQAKDAYIEMVRKIESLEDDGGNAAITLAAALAALPPPPSCI